MSEILSKNPIHYFEIGAAGGFQSEWRLFDNKIKLFGFEPNQDSFKELSSNANEKFFNIGVAEKKSEHDIYLNTEPNTSSFYRINDIFVKKFFESERFLTKKIEVIKCDSFSNILYQENIKEIDIIKLDVQGYEYNILKGISEKDFS
ncbi:MAG: FkbM family methyltransferase [Ignavibacteriaceae bacterium]